MRSKLTDRLFLLIQEHDFMQPDGVEFLNLYSCKKPYEVLEKILLNVASKNGITWISLLKANQDNVELYAELCVSVILVDRYLKELFHFTEEQRYSLIGYKFANLIDAYNQNVSQK